MMLRDIDNELPPAKRPSKLEVSLEYIWNLIENCFSHDPIQRPSATNILSRTDPTMKDGSGAMGSPISPVKGEEELEPRDQEECSTPLEATKDMARLLPQSGVLHGQSRSNKTKRLFTKVSSVLFSVKSPGPKSETLCTVCGVKYTWNFNDQGENLEYSAYISGIQGPLHYQSSINKPHPLRRHLYMQSVSLRAARIHDSKILKATLADSVDRDAESEELFEELFGSRLTDGYAFLVPVFIFRATEPTPQYKELQIRFEALH
ncbi:hypothetical protein FRC20_006782 [Serendipita sp. 405]|nr:hypothetical protein FRC20_006782 [Serendipita sp. 405]